MVRIRVGSGSTGSDGRKLGVAGRVLGSVFFGVFLAMGLLFVGLILKTAQAELATRSYTAVPARILESDFEIDAGREIPYRFRVLFEYDTPTGTFRSDTATNDGEAWTGDFHDVQRMLTDYPVGAAVTAYADPVQPGPAILKHGSLWIVAAVLFPLIFVAIGAGGLYHLWFGGGSPRATSRAMTDSVGRSSQLGNAGLLLLFGIFTVVGAILSWFLGINPLFRTWSASAWPATPAVVERADLLAFSDSDGTTYRIDILYRYEVDGQTFRSNAYNFSTGSSSGQASKLAVVHQHPVGSTVTCYVNPNDPTVAVLNPSLGWSALFALIPAVFLFIGVLGLLGTASGRGAAGERALFPSAARADANDGDAPRIVEPITLTSGKSRRTACIVLTLVATFWTGISGFMWLSLWSEGEWIGLAFLSLFVLAGLGMCAAAVYQFLGLFNPHVHLTLPREGFALGAPITIRWALTGNASRLRDFALTLEGQEHATYRQGTDTRTDTHTFRTIPLLKIDDPARIADARGEAQGVFPVDSMHSFKADRNEIRWVIRATGTVARWPDVKDEWTIQVAPMGRV